MADLMQTQNIYKVKARRMWTPNQELVDFVWWNPSAVGSKHTYSRNTYDGAIFYQHEFSPAIRVFPNNAYDLFDLGNTMSDGSSREIRIGTENYYARITIQCVNAYNYNLFFGAVIENGVRITQETVGGPDRADDYKYVIFWVQDLFLNSNFKSYFRTESRQKYFGIANGYYPNGSTRTTFTLTPSEWNEVPPADNSRYVAFNCEDYTARRWVYVTDQGKYPPYSSGGNSSTGGGENQHFDEKSDKIDLPGLPVYTASASGFLTAYVPTIGEINALANYLLTPNVFQALGQVAINLDEMLVGLSIFPFSVTASNSKVIKVNFMGVTLESGVTSHYADNQFYELDMGTIHINPCWDNCLDYNPYTKISIFLPYCGVYELDADEVMDKDVQVKYRIDIISGVCLAAIIVGGSVMYQFPGECSCQIPLSSASYDSFLQSMVSLGIAGASGAMAVKGASAGVKEARRAAIRGASDEAVEEAEMNELATRADVASQLGVAAVNAVTSGKANYSHAGAMSASPGFMGVSKPYITIIRPEQSMPENYGSMMGYPSNIKSKLGDLSGFTVVDEIHLNIPDATVEEIVECERFLKEGVRL